MTIKVLNHAATAKTEVPSAKNIIFQPLQCQCKELKSSNWKKGIQNNINLFGSIIGILNNKPHMTSTEAGTLDLLLPRGEGYRLGYNTGAIL